MYPSHFKTFHTSITELPHSFPFPFQNEPHPLCRMAAFELQKEISQHPGWNQLFGLNTEDAGTGKMFGVLVVQHADGTVGYLSGFSGAIDGNNTFPGFVPPVYDLLNPTDFFKLGEAQLSQLNETIDKLENSAELISAKQKLADALKALEQAQAEWKVRILSAKKDRKQQRHEAQALLEGSEQTHRLDALNRASQLEKIAFKKDIAGYKERSLSAEHRLLELQKPIETLKSERKRKSARLQSQIFDQFRLLNLNQEVKSVTEIFSEQGEEVPPAGAGDCAGPKLLQYAFQNQLKPIALAEFWWGASPKSEIRKHSQFYPPCRNKCAPIMQHMLKHLDITPDLMSAERKAPLTLNILFEDEWLMVVNKPEGFLSVPGKEVSDSVLKRVRQMRTTAEGPLLVHRLDMATSGILLIAKDPLTHKSLQSQFIKRSTKKRYVALLDGLLSEDSGTIDLPLRVDLNDRPRQLVCFEYGKAARTHWEVIRREDGKTRVHFYPVTGRTHQLRVHAAHPAGLNTPIVGDPLYGTVADRLYLHAETLEIIHPQTRKPITFTAPTPF